MHPRCEDAPDLVKEDHTMNTPNETNETKTPKTQRPTFWMRTIEGRKNRLTREYRTTLNDTARAGISDEDYATTMATLEKMARNLGWDESQHDERGFGPLGHGFGRRGGPRGYRGGFPGGFSGGFSGDDHRGHRPQNLPNETPEG